MPTSAIKPPQFKRIAITTGDPLGVGFEVTAKALVSYLKNKKKIPLFFIFRDFDQHRKQPRLFKKLDAVSTRLTFYDLEIALKFANTLKPSDVSNQRIIIDLSLRTSAPAWVFQATQACLDKNLSSIVTGPLSKLLIRSSGFKQMGHTGIFRSFFPKIPLHMGFVGRDFNVMLVTDHVPLSRVERTLTPAVLKAGLKSAQLLKLALNSKKQIAVLGLNPHAGESGLIGKTEKVLFKSLPIGFQGPLVPDAAFLKKNWKRYSLFVCLYHDQGLIPFKMHHGQDSGVHVTLGLPFIRTSVDHGTAFDIYNKNLANSSSMLEAIHLNQKLLEKTDYV